MDPLRLEALDNHDNQPATGAKKTGGGWQEGIVVFRKEWYRKTGKEVMEGHPLLHRLLGFKCRCTGCLKLIIMMLF